MFDAVLTKSFVMIGKKKIYLNDSFPELEKKMESNDIWITLEKSSVFNIVGKKEKVQKQYISSYGRAGL